MTAIQSMLAEMLRLCLLPVELMAGTLLYMSPLSHRKHYALRVLCCCALELFAFIFIFAGLLNTYQTLDLFVISLLYSICAYGLSVLLIWACCSVNVPAALYFATCAYLTQHIAYCLNRLLTPGIADGDLSTYSPIYFVIYGLVYLAIRLLFVRNLTDGENLNMRPGRSLRLTASSLAVALLLSAVGQRFQGESPALYAVCLLYGVFCCFFVLWGQLSQQRQLALQHELDVQQQLWLKHKAQYEMSAENVELINRKCHDLKHQIAALKHIPDRAQRERSIQELEHSVMIYDAMTETGNQILDTILTEKGLICEARGITLSCVADGACLNFMDAVDLYTIFGNALDNAVESVQALEDPDMRYISVAVFARSGMAFIQMENFTDKPLKYESGLPVTSKTTEPGCHGYGLRSIRYTAEKYGGILKVNSEGDVFRLQVSIPLS